MEIDVLQVSAMLAEGADFKLLDVRTPGERAIASIAGSELVTRELVEEIMDTWPRDTRIVCYCHTGIRSLAAARFLHEQGHFSDVRSMAGGIAAWSAAVDPDVPNY